MPAASSTHVGQITLRPLPDPERSQPDCQHAAAGTVHGIELTDTGVRVCGWLTIAFITLSHGPDNLTPAAALLEPLLKSGPSG